MAPRARRVGARLASALAWEARGKRPYETVRPSAAGSASKRVDPLGLVGSQAVAIEQDGSHAERSGARDVVLVGVAHHRRFPGLHLQHSESRDEDRRMRLRPAVEPRSDHRVDLQPVMGDELLEVALPVRDQPDLHPVPAKLVEDGEHVLVEREVLVSLPLAHHVGRALPGAFRVPTHAADDLLRERDPDLVVVHEPPFGLQFLDGSGACFLVARRVERQPVPLADAPIPLRPELRPRPKEGEIDVEENRAEHGSRIALGHTLNRGLAEARPLPEAARLL